MSSAAIAHPHTPSIKSPHPHGTSLIIPTSQGARNYTQGTQTLDRDQSDKALLT